MQGCFKAVLLKLKKAFLLYVTFLTSQYKRTLLIAVKQDGCVQTMLVSFAILDRENYDVWNWFFSKININVKNK